MAYQYDDFGNIVGEYESEEERRQREQQELADTAIQTQEIKTYGDGTQEVITKQEIPPELQRQQDAYKQAVAPVTVPVSPDQAAYTRQQESGNRRDIGYHFQPNAQGQRQSTAFGPYGITEAAYKDIARQDPTLAKPITSWTQEEHDRGYNTLVGRNQARLTQLGIEPSVGVLQLSHLLGPDGAARFMKTGQVSEAAAAANGGADRLKQIAQGRFAGSQNAASSGAAVQQQPSGQIPGLTPTSQMGPQPNSFDEFGTPMFSQAQADLDRNLTNYQTAQNDPSALLNLSKDSTLPEWLKDRSRNRAADLIIEQRQDAKAQKEIAELDENKIARLLRERKGEGSRLKGILYAAFGLDDLANEEKYKLGIGIDKEDMINGQTVIVKVAANGKAIDGINVVTGKELTAREIATYNAGIVAPGSKLNVVGGTYVNDTTKEVGRVVTNEKTGKSYVQTDTGKKPMTGFRPQGQSGTMDMQKAQQIQKQNIDLAGDWAKLQMRIQGAAPEAANKYLGEFNAKHGTQFGLQNISGSAPQISMETGQMVQQAPTVQTAPTAQTAPMSTTGQTPSAIERQGKTQELQTQSFVKFENEDLIPRAEAGQTIARVRKEQINGPDGILNNPEIANLLQGSSSGEVSNIIRDLVTGNYTNQADLSARIASLKLDDRQKAVLYRQIGLNNQIAPLTLRANAGPGAVSDAEQKANRDANVDITRQPLYSGLSLLTKDQFMKDQMQARAEFKAQNPQFKTTAEFNTAWNAEKARLDKQYDSIYAARAAYIAKYNLIDKDGRATNPGAVVAAYKLLPVPEWNGETRSWDYITPQAEAIAKKASRRPLNTFNK